MMKSRNQTLRANKVIRLQSIFEKHGWAEISNTDNCEFEDFCSMLSHLSDSQQDLVLSLTEDFLQVNALQYAPLFFDAYKKLLIDLSKEYDKVFIQPLLSPKDFHKQKSSTALFYLVKAEEVALKRISGRLEIKFIDNHMTLFNAKVESSTLVCLIDDYVGTGDTAEKAVEYLQENGIPASNIRIVSIVAQQAACERLNKKNIPVYYSVLRNKGLSENTKYSSDDIEVMRRIENKMRIRKEYRFGYGQTEGLVKLIRIPNNTFPVYWYPCKSIPIVPFPRKG